MALRRAQPTPYIVKGVSDALDGTNAPRGSMVALTNLIPDPTTQGLFVCRPASVLQTDFFGVNTPGFISAMKVIGTRAYGMIASAQNAGRDEPFCFDLVTGMPVAITGVTGPNTPISPATVGAWTPPTMALIGVQLIVTHPGFTGLGGNYFGWFDLTNPAAPVWHAGNTAPTALPAVPTNIAQYHGRGWFAVGAALYYSDALTPTVITNGTQILTTDDNVAITALGGLPLDNQLGGIIQSLIVFKGAEVMGQITGDQTTTDLAYNTLNVATGTLAPNTVTPSPRGLFFVSPEGVRLIDFNAHVSDPVGVAGDGVTVPFIYSVVPSRMAAAFAGDTLRVSTQNGIATGSPNQEFWFNLSRGMWTGPHSFPASLIQPSSGSFVMTPLGIPAALFRSDPTQLLTSTYVENGAQMTWAWQTSLFPDNGQMEVQAIIETTIAMALVSGVAAYSFNALDQNGAVLDTVSVVSGGGATIWGAFIWGAAPWQGAQNAYAPRQIPWHLPIVANRMAVSGAGNSSSGFRIGNMFNRIQVQKYLLTG